MPLGLNGISAGSAYDDDISARENYAQIRSSAVGIDTVAAFRNEGDYAADYVNAVVAFERVVRAGDGLREIFHLEILFGVNSVIVCGNDDQFAFAAEGKFANRIYRNSSLKRSRIVRPPIL